MSSLKRFRGRAPFLRYLRRPACQATLSIASLINRRYFHQLHWPTHQPQGSGNICSTQIQLQLRRTIVDCPMKQNAQTPEEPETQSVINKTQFRHTVDVLGLQIPASECSKVIKHCRQYLLKRPKVKPVLREKKVDRAEESCVIRIDLQKLPADMSDEDSFLQAVKDKVSDEFGEQVAAQLSAVHHEIEIGYESLSVEEIFSKLIPLQSSSDNLVENTDTAPSSLEDLHYPSSFATVGHLAHLNLREYFLPYKYVIGQVILDKNPRLRTVVNKTSSISNQYRTFPMEVIAGDPDFEVTVKEHNCLFKFNFEQVYWNSKLQEEHWRLVKLILSSASPSPSLPGSQSAPEVSKLVVADIFCGVGPFAVPLACHSTAALRVEVHASDLNPRSYHYLEQNVALNKLTNQAISCYNLDAKEFILTKIASAELTPDHIIMNLPDSAIDFVQYFVGTFVEESWQEKQQAKLPTVHCYCFSKDKQSTELGSTSKFSFEGDVRKRVEEALGTALCTERHGVEIRRVRDVAPNKLMMCIHFKLTPEIVFRRHMDEQANGLVVGSDSPLSIMCKKQKVH